MNIKEQIEEILLTDYQYVDCYTVQKLLDLFAVIKSLPDDYEIYQKAHEVDEKDFAQWMYECQKGNVL